MTPELDRAFARLEDALRDLEIAARDVELIVIELKALSGIVS